MKVTKQHKILGIVLVVGAIALGSDRLLFLKSPATETIPEAASSYAVAPAPAKPAGAEKAAEAAPAGVSISQRLRRTAESIDASANRDAFTLGAAWPAQVAAPQRAQANNSADQFRQAHHLTGALTSGATAHVMIDGKIVAIGESIDGYRLVAIEHRSVTFEPAEGEPVILNMNERAGGNPAVSASAVP